MDKVTRDMVVGQLKAADKPEALHTALVSAMIAVVDCQCATGARIKRQGVIIGMIGIVLLVCILADVETARKILLFVRGGS